MENTNNIKLNNERRLLIVANRLPYQLYEKGKTLSFRQSSGGLVSALKSYFERKPGDHFSEKIWVGYPGFGEEKWKRILSAKPMTDEFCIEPVFINEKTYDSYYNGFSNSVLWPLFHYFPSYVTYKNEYFEAYRKVNELFAEKILSIANENDVIWIHDYHLCLLPSLLRKAKPDLTIGFFLHIPFPSYEVIRLLPRQWKQEILKGLLGADLVGFHTIDYKRYFLEALQMVLNADNEFGNVFYQKRVIRTDLFPIGIDYEKFRSAAEDPKVIQLRTDIQKNFLEQKIIFSLDRLDYTKGVMQRLNGYELFLNQHAEWREKVVMVLNVIPSRDKVFKYSERKRMIEEKVSSINGKFSSYTWQPIVYFYKHQGFEDLCALYQTADVALITPLRDGMNLIAKEYIASQADQQGVLVLSELAGAANELNEALLVNPVDESEIAGAIYKALTLPVNEQIEKVSLMQKRLMEYDVTRWVEDFLYELKKSKELQKERGYTVFDQHNCEIVIDKTRNAAKRLFFFDYDGTLTPFSRYPSDAAPDHDVLKKLSLLVQNPRNEVVIISGRDKNTLEKWLGDLPVTIVAEHGAMIKYPGSEWQELSPKVGGWKEVVLPTLQLFSNRCNGSFIEEKEFSVAWHYRNVQPQLGFSRSRELIQTLTHTLANTPLQVVDGNKVVEVRTASSNKGLVATRIAEDYKPDFILAIGDDKTDEDMFRALQNRAITIKIGTGTTIASYNMPYQSEVIGLLDILISMECN